MRILALDTTSQGCSVALFETGCVLAELNMEKKETHSKHLMAMIDGVLQVAGMVLDDVDAYAVAQGPGSFTGLRIGLSAIKGLCFATDKPLVGVSSLEALAMGAAGFGLPVCPMIDARKNEVYLAHYVFEDGQCKTLKSPCAAGESVLCDGIDTETVFVGTGVDVFGHVIRERLGCKAVMPPRGFHQIRAGYVAEIAEKRLLDGADDETAGLTPTYIRKSDAELNLKIPSKASSPD